MEGGAGNRGSGGKARAEAVNCYVKYIYPYQMGEERPLEGLLGVQAETCRQAMGVTAGFPARAGDNAGYAVLDKSLRRLPARARSWRSALKTSRRAGFEEHLPFRGVKPRHCASTRAAAASSAAAAARRCFPRRRFHDQAMRTSPV